MHVVLQAIRIVVIPEGVTVLLGLCNPPRNWTAIAPCVVSLPCYRLIRRPKSILQDSPKI
jgi:hypothetical protein